MPKEINTIEAKHIGVCAVKMPLGRNINIISNNAEVRITCVPQIMKQQPNINFFIEVIFSWLWSIGGINCRTCILETGLRG